MGTVVVLCFSNACLLIRAVLSALVPLRRIEVGACARFADASSRVELALSRRDLVVEAASEALSLVELFEEGGSEVTLNTCCLLLFPLALGSLGSDGSI